MCSGCLYSSRQVMYSCIRMVVHTLIYVSAVRARMGLAEVDLNVSVGDIVLQVPFTCCKI